MKRPGASQGQSASELISKRIAELGDWRGETLGRMRKLIKEADPDVVEEWKWMGTPVWSHDGIICTGESYKNVVKLTFSKGASLKDPTRLFNSSLDGNVRRAIDIHEGEEVDKPRLQGARSPSGRPQQFWQVETFEESEVLRDSASEQVQSGGGSTVPPERTQAEDGLDSRKGRTVGLLTLTCFSFRGKAPRFRRSSVHTARSQIRQLRSIL